MSEQTTTADEWPGFTGAYFSGWNDTQWADFTTTYPDAYFVLSVPNLPLLSHVCVGVTELRHHLSRGFEFPFVYPYDRLGYPAPPNYDQRYGFNLKVAPTPGIDWAAHCGWRRPTPDPR